MNTYPSQADLENHPVVTREEWLAARKKLLVEEKALTRRTDAVSAMRRDLPWVRVEQDYRFTGPDGELSLAGLFGSRSQLLVYHFMLTPDSDEPCPGCSFIADHVDAARQHFEHNDLSFAAVSRARIGQIASVKKRMGWTFRWVSSFGSSFNSDYGVSFTPEQIARRDTPYNYSDTPQNETDLHGTSVFYKNAAGQIFHTYSTYARGDEAFLGAYRFLDLAPRGRNEKDTMDWVRHHDRYESGGSGSSCCSGGAA